MFVLEEIQLSVPKKSNCVKANYLGGPALISHLKMPFVSRLVFLRLSLSNKKSNLNAMIFKVLTQAHLNLGEF